MVIHDAVAFYFFLEVHIAAYQRSVMNAQRSDNKGRVFFYIDTKLFQNHLWQQTLLASLWNLTTSKDDMARGKDDSAPMQASGW